MHSANGVELSTNQYRELRRIVKEEKRGNGLGYCRNRLAPDPETGEPDMQLAQTYIALGNRGLISGLPCDDSYTVAFINQAAFDFVDDCRRESRQRWLRAYLPSIIAAVVGVGGTIAGVLLGWHLGTLS